MVHEKLSIREKNKPRGRPFQKGNKRGKSENCILASPGHKIGDEGGAVTPPLNSVHEEPLKDNNGIFSQLTKKAVVTVEKTLKEFMNKPQEELKKDANTDILDSEDKNSKDLELIDTIDFKNGENTLSIRFSKRHNRMFRIQIFLNQDNEIRPVTYNGARTGYTFWNLLKGAMKK